MALALGGLTGALAKGSETLTGEESLKKFLHRMNQVGVQIKSRYEMSFSGIKDFTFFATGIETPAVTTRMGDLYFGGRSVSVPILEEFEHEVTITMLNDSSGYIYPTIVNLHAMGATEEISSQGFSITIKAIGDKHTNGSVITLNGCRIKNVSGLQFGDDQNDAQTFTIGLWVKDFSCGSGKLGVVGGVAGMIKSLVG